MTRTIYIAIAVIVIFGIGWYVMRAQRQAAAINAAGGTPTAPPAVTGADA